MWYRTLFIAGAMLVAASACDDGSEGTGPEGRAAIEGRVDLAGGGPAAASGPTAATVAQASTAAVMQVGAGGAPQLLAEADIEASGHFRVGDVPEGRTGLIVVVRDEAGAELGGVLVHGETEVDVTTFVAPVDAETTVESRAYIQLGADGEVEAAQNSGGLAAFVRLSGPESDGLASSSEGVRLVADAFAEAEADLDAAFGEFGLGLDAQSRADATASLALQYASSRHDGAPIGTSHEILVGAVLDAYAAAGASNRDIVLATAAAASGAATVSVGGDAAARLTVVRQAADVNLRARQRLAAELSGVAGGSATVEALAQARADLQVADGPAAVQAELDAVTGSVQTAVVAGILELLSDVSLIVRNEVQTEIEAAFAEADLATRLEGEASAAARGAVLAQYRADVEGAVEAIVAAMPSGVSLDTEAMVSLLIAAGASGAVS